MCEYIFSPSIIPPAVYSVSTLPPHCIPLHPAIVIFWSTWVFLIILLHIILIPYLPVTSPLVLPLVPPAFYLILVVLNITLVYLPPPSSPKPPALLV